MDRQRHTTFRIAAAAMPLNSCSLAVAMSRSRLSIPLVATVMTGTVWLEHEANDSRLSLPHPLFYY